MNTILLLKQSTQQSTPFVTYIQIIVDLPFESRATLTRITRATFTRIDIHTTRWLPAIAVLLLITHSAQSENEIITYSSSVE